MNTGALLWIIIFAVAAAVFFIVAAVVSIRGVSDLKDLLRSKRDDP
jgi:hypothetical protein